MFIALVVGCAVCTALSMSGAFISDFKIGYWIGSTPRNQEMWKFAGIIVASLVVAFVIPVMDSGYHFLVRDPATGELVSNTKVLPAPQANMIAAVSKGLLEDAANQPWLLYGLGGFVAIMLYMAGVPMLAFALGIYLPISINMAVLAGAFVAHLVGSTGGSEKVKKARQDQGILIASGLMAGAAIFGIITAILRQPALGAPIQYHFHAAKSSCLTQTPTGELFLESKPAGWYEGICGPGDQPADVPGPCRRLLPAGKEGRRVGPPRGGRSRRRRSERVRSFSPAQAFTGPGGRRRLAGEGRPFAERFPANLLRPLLIRRTL